MFRIAGMVCAAGCVLGLAAGCALTLKMIGLDLAIAETEYVMLGTVDETAIILQQAMQRHGIEVKMIRDGEAVRLHSTSPGGKQFDLVLTRVQTAQGAQTHVHLAWVNGADSSYAKLLVDVFLSRAPPAGAQK